MLVIVLFVIPKGGLCLRDLGLVFRAARVKGRPLLALLVRDDINALLVRDEKISCGHPEGFYPRDLVLVFRAARIKTRSLPTVRDDINTLLARDDKDNRPFGMT